MRDFLRRGARAAFDVTHGIYRLSRAPKPTSNFAMTVDEDDLATARLWLAKKDQWSDRSSVQQYERAFALWNGSQHAFAFQAGRKALSACIYALELKEGDEVIMPGFTCVLLPNAFEFQGVKVVFCDIELDTYGPDLKSIEARISTRTRAIVVQHLFGIVCRDYEKIVSLANRNNLHVIEDCAQSTGASLDGKKVGTRGTVGFYSSERSKVFSTVIGGVAVTDRAEVAKRLQFCSENWKVPSEHDIEKQLQNVRLDYYRFKHPMAPVLFPVINLFNGAASITNMMPDEMLGRVPQDYYARMPAPIAALGLNQLQKIDSYNAARRVAAARWDQWCGNHGYKRPLVLPGSTPVFLRYPILVEPERKADVRWARDELGVELGVWFKTNVHPTARLVEGCPNADLAVERCVNFPTLLN